MPLAFFFGLERGVSQSHNWKNLDIGAVFTNIRDGRGAGAVREVADWEDFCTQVQHIGSERTENVSVTPTQVLSYVSGLNYDATNSVSQLFGKSGIRKQLISSRPDPSVLWPNTQKSQTSAAVIAILKQLKIDFVSVYMSKKDNECLEAFDNFRNSAQLAHICIADEKFVGSENMTLTEPPATLVVLMFTNTLDTRVLLEAHRSQWPGKRNMYIFVGKSLEWDGDRLNDWNNQLLGSLAIQNESPSRPDFLEFLGSITPELLPQPWLMDFWQSHFNCSPNGYQSSRQLSPCTGRERLPVSKLGHLMNERNLITAVENFLSHIDHTYGLLCPKRTGFCEAFHRHYREHPFEISSLSEPLWVIRNFQLRHNTNSVLLEVLSLFGFKSVLLKLTCF